MCMPLSMLFICACTTNKVVPNIVCKIIVSYIEREKKMLDIVCCT